MKTSDIIATANTNMLRNKGRSFLTILAVFIGAFTIVLTTSINTGVNQYIDDQMAGTGGEDYIEIFPESTLAQVSEQFLGSDEIQEYSPEKSQDVQSISDEDMEKIRAVHGIKSAAPYRQLSVEYITSGETDKKFVYKVLELPSNNITPPLVTGRIVALDAGQLQLTLLPGYSGKLGFKSDKAAIGQKVTLGVQNRLSGKIKKVDATITGVQEKTVFGGGSSWINTSLSNELYAKIVDGMPDSLKDKAMAATAELYEGSSDQNIADIKAALSEIGYTAMTTEDQIGLIKTFFDAITLVLTIFGVIALLAASIGIINTLFMSVQERTREIGLMKAMGLASGSVRTVFSLEAISLGFWGSVLGVAGAFLAGNLANSIAADTFLSGLPGFTLVVFDVWNIAGIILLVIAIAFLAGLLPAIRAARLHPIDALRYE
ncbi:MAG: FtsX-like permease family protein [Candidatus Nomurabacteria bacterium]|jgi:putative ABC transport system permease protein|nr:FtsX-like permease family protein [Candidatus Nomurabacteria bacterium]